MDYRFGGNVFAQNAHRVEETVALIGYDKILGSSKVKENKDEKKKEEKDNA